MESGIGQQRQPRGDVDGNQQCREADSCEWIYLHRQREFRTRKSVAGNGVSVVYVGSGSSVTVSNLLPSTTYNVAVFSYAGATTTTTYNRTPATGSITIPPNTVIAQACVQAPNVVITFTAN